MDARNGVSGVTILATSRVLGPWTVKCVRMLQAVDGTVVDLRGFDLVDIEIRVLDEGHFARWWVGMRGGESLLQCHERG